MSADPIERIKLPPAGVFRRDFVRRGRPVVVTDALAQWAAPARWTWEYLRATLGDQPVTVLVSDDGRFTADEAAGYRDRARTLAFAEFLDLCGSADPRGPRYYLQQTSLPGRFPALKRDVALPPFVERGRLGAINLWIGAQGSVTPLHYDAQDNLLAQIAGRKRITLFAPSQLARLYPYPMLSQIPHHARVDPERPDRIRFPRFRPSAALRFVLSPGEALFLPNGWWHEVCSLDTSISVNIWWRAEWPRFLSPSILRLLPGFSRLLARRLVRIARSEVSARLRGRAP